MTPKDFIIFPWNSVVQKNEYETVAQNVMKILSRTGNTFRKLTLREYIVERGKDGNYSTAEESVFCNVIDYCVSPETARLFSPKWREIY